MRESEQYSEDEDEQEPSYRPRDRKSGYLSGPTSASGPSQQSIQMWPGPQTHNWTNLQGPPPNNAPWQGPGTWQQPPAQSGWLWKQPDTNEGASKKTAGKKKLCYAISEDSDDSSEDSDGREKKKKKKEKEKSWEKETAKQRKTRYRKYKKMNETTDTDKQSVSASGFDVYLPSLMCVE